MNKNRSRISNLLVLAALFTGCSHDMDSLPGGENPDGRVALQVSSGIEVQTRAHDDDWDSNDAIGIFGFTQGSAPTMVYSNIPYHTDFTGSGGFSPTGTVIYLPIDDTSLDFYAYYPYKELPDRKTYMIDVTDQSIQKNIDLMAAGKQDANRDYPMVHFTFAHKLAKVEFAFKAGSGMSEDDLKGMTVELTGQETKANFDVTNPDGSVIVVPDNKKTLTLYTSYDQGTSSEGIVLPSESFDGMTLKLTLAGGKGSFEWKVKSDLPDVNGFEEGKKYLYTITVNKTNIRVTAAIRDWTPGNGGGETGSAE